MDSPSHILVLIIVAITVTSAQVPLESFQLCIADHGLSPDLIVHHSAANLTLYAQLDHRWNIRPVHTHPLAYFVPRFTSDVQVGVRCARANSIPVIVKSGGHSAELLSHGNAGTIIIAFQNMKEIQVNASEKTAVIQTGALLGEIREKLLNEGFGLPSGDCNDVGIGGIALGGGDGQVTPIYNLTVDSILEMEMVDANGDLHLVNENVNTDLFWALRGVGSGYIGIVTSFKFKLFNATDLMTTRISFSYDLEDVGSVLLAYQDFLVWAENEGLNARIVILIRGITNSVNLICQLLEEISSAQPTNAELFLNKANEIFPPLEGQEVTLTFPSYAELRSGEEEDEFPSINVDPAVYVKKKAFFVNRTVSAEELEKLVEIFQRGRNLHLLIYFFGFTGVFNKISANEMSYVHRGHLYLVSHRVRADAQASVEEAQSAHKWLNEFERESKVIDNGESYQNYVDLDLSDNFMERYYGVNAQRIMEIKKKWDPDNYFQNKLSIPVANTATNMAHKSILLILTISLLFLFIQCN